MDSRGHHSLSSDDAGPSLVPGDMSDLFCDPCLEDGNHLQVEGYCVDCAHHLCGMCFLHHCRPKPWRHHQLLDKQQMPITRSDKIYKDECTDMCTIHKEKTVKYFCEDHKLFGCTVCVTLGHRTCNVGYIPTLSGDIFDSKEYKAFKEDLESLANETKSLQESATRNIDDVKHHAERAIDKVRQLRTDVNTFFDDLEHTILEEISQIQNEDQDKIEALLEQCETLAETIKDMQADIDDKESKNQKCRLFVDIKQLRASLDRHNEDANEIEINNSIRDLTFKPSDKIVSLIRDQSEKFGSLIDYHQILPVTLPSDEDEACRITDITVLSEGRIVVWDYNNACLKVIDTKYDKVITSLTLSDITTLTLTTVSDNEFALSNVNEIYLYSVTDRIKLTRTIQTSVSVRGIFYTNNMFIVSTWSTPSTVCMVNMNGDIVKTFPTKLDGQHLFKYPDYIAINPDQTAIYVSDWGKDTVTCLTFDGEVKSQYKYRGEWFPRGVAVSRDGLVYVCDPHNDNIHILSPDLKDVGKISGEKYKLRHLWGLAYCDKEHKLYVGMVDQSIKFMADSGSDVVTIRQEVLDTMDLELIGPIRSKGVHASRTKNLYRANLRVGNQIVEIEVMGESYDSIGSRVLRHFRHYINGSRHVWLKGDFIDPELSPKSSQMTSSQGSLTTTSSSSQEKSLEHSIPSLSDTSLPSFSQEHSQSSEQPEEKSEETSTPRESEQMEHSALDTDASVQNDCAKNGGKSHVELAQPDIITSNTSSNNVDFNFVKVAFSKDSELKNDETDKVVCDNDDVIDIRPIINANRKRHASDNSGFEPKCGDAEVTKIRRKNRRAIQDNLNSLRTIKTNNNTCAETHVTGIENEAEIFHTVMGQRSVYYRSQTKQQKGAES